MSPVISVSGLTKTYASGLTWRTVTLFNPDVYLISGFRWSF